MNTNDYTHNFHPYAAKFPAAAIRPLIERYTRRDDIVLDPFCGSGTTLVECRLLGRNAVGIELNPVGVLISRCKSYPFSKEDTDCLREILEELEGEGIGFEAWVERYSRDGVTLDFPNKELWYEPLVFKELTALYNYITEKSKDSPMLSLLLKTAFSRILVNVSNQESETRYASVTKGILKKETFNRFVSALKNYHSTIAMNLHNINREINVEVIEGDALKAMSILEPNSIDFSITSPPYINSYDYYLYHKQRILWLGADPRLVRRNEMGGHHTVDRMSYENALQVYSSNMQKIAEEVFRVLKKGKYFVILIADGIVKGKIVNVTPLIRNISAEVGFSLLKTESVPSREVSRGFIKGEYIDRKMHHVMILRKPE